MKRKNPINSVKMAAVIKMDPSNSNISQEVGDGGDRKVGRK